MEKLKRSYKKISKTSFARVEFYKLRTELGENKADQELKYALNYNPVSLNVYLQLIENYLNQDNTKKANRVIESAWTAYEGRDELYPYVLKTKMAEGDIEAANKVMKSCEKNKPLIYDEMCRRPYKEAKKKHKEKKLKAKEKNQKIKVLLKAKKINLSLGSADQFSTS
jgi:DNA-binding SARP family transcriptional activator